MKKEVQLDSKKTAKDRLKDWWSMFKEDFPDYIANSVTVIFWILVIVFFMAWINTGPKNPGNTPVKNAPSTSSPTFGGNSCTGDCSGHQSGYDWASDHGITDPDDCGGNSNSFIEGCQTYADEQSDY